MKASSGFYVDMETKQPAQGSAALFYHPVPLLMCRTVWSKNQDPRGPPGPPGLHWALLPSSGEQAGQPPAETED